MDREIIKLELGAFDMRKISDAQDLIFEAWEIAHDQGREDLKKLLDSAYNQLDKCNNGHPRECTPAIFNACLLLVGIRTRLEEHPETTDINLYLKVAQALAMLIKEVAEVFS